MRSGLAGLKAARINIFPESTEAEGRIVLKGRGGPAGWPHDLPAIELWAVVGFDGAVSDVEIRCAATDGDPLMKVYNALNVQQCKCQLADLPVTLKEVWIARREVIARLKAKTPIFDGKWNWASSDGPALKKLGESCDARHRT